MNKGVILPAALALVLGTVGGVQAQSAAGTAAGSGGGSTMTTPGNNTGAGTSTTGTMGQNNGAMRPNSGAMGQNNGTAGQNTGATAPTMSNGAPVVSGTNSATNNAVNSSEKNKGAPVPGANSFTQGEASRRLQAKGYSNVTGLKLDKQGIWRGKATKDGKSSDVALDYQGNIVSQ